MSPSIPPSLSLDGIAPPPQSAHARKKRTPPTPGSEGHHIPRAEGQGPLPKMHISWKDGSSNYLGMPVARPLSQGPAQSRVDAAEAAKHLRRIDSMVRERWNRAGWDERGGDISVIVNLKGMGGNAYFGVGPDGKGEMGIGVRDAAIGFKKSPAYSPSILMHEYVHGIVDTELRNMPKHVQPYLNQREHNAVNESIADVLALGMLDTTWKIGHEIRDGVPLRDLADPSVTRWIPAVRKDSGLEEHSLSGVVSRAAVIAAESGGTLGVVDAWYAGINKHYRSELMHVKAPFAGRALGAWVRATMRGAEDVGGKGSGLVESMRSGWEAVGLGRYASDAQLGKTSGTPSPATKPKRRSKP